MSEAIENISKKLRDVYNLDTTKEVIKAIIMSINEKYPNINTQFIEEAVINEEIRRKEAKEETEKSSKAMLPINNYIEKLIEAAISEMINRHGQFEIPGYCSSFENDDDTAYEDVEADGFFTKNIQSRYELCCLECWKDDLSHQGHFAVKPIGKLRDILNSHGLDVDRIEVEFNGEPGEESVLITEEGQIYDCMGEIDISWNKATKVQKVIAAAMEIEANPNKNLLIHELRYSG